MKKKLEENNLKVQLELFRENEEHQSMIEYHISLEAGVLFREIIEPQMFMKDDQEIVEMKVEHHIRLRVFLASLMNIKDWDNLNKSIGEYIEKKNKNKQIIYKLNS